MSILKCPHCLESISVRTVVPENKRRISNETVDSILRLRKKGLSFREIEKVLEGRVSFSHAKRIFDKAQRESKEIEG